MIMIGVSFLGVLIFGSLDAFGVAVKMLRDARPLGLVPLAIAMSFAGLAVYIVKSV